MPDKKTTFQKMLKSCCCFFFLLPCFIEIPVFNANSADPDQMSHSAASDLGLHCLPMSLLWDARHKGLNYKQEAHGP